MKFKALLNTALWATYILFSAPLKESHLLPTTGNGPRVTERTTVSAQNGLLPVKSWP